MTRHYLFHITPLEHLPSVFSSGHLKAPNTLPREASPPWWNSATLKRRRLTLPCPPGGALLEYVSFYFFRHPPQLYRTPSHAPQDWAYLITDVDTIRHHQRPFAFSDGDPLLWPLTQFYHAAHPFHVIDDTLHHHKRWSSTPADLDLDRRRSATLLVRHRLPLSALLGCAVATPQHQLTLRQMLRDHGLELDVIIRPEWY